MNFRSVNAMLNVQDFGDLFVAEGGGRNRGKRTQSGIEAGEMILMMVMMMMMQMKYD